MRFDVADAADRRVPLNAYPFQLGVASGDPSSSGVVLWTRLVTDPLNGGGMPDESIRVEWQVCDDEAMTKVVQKGTATASPDWAHSVHVEVEGLKPDRGYFYQFKVGSDVSPIGRTRTAPTAGTTLARFRFAFASCQHWEMGFYNAYEHMAKEDLSLVVHLGDYIYEKKAGKKGNVRLHNGDELKSLDDYRNRHALYKTDEHLQAAHQAFPWLLTWDDHEVDNNYAGATSEKADIDPAAFLRRRANAYKAYYEHMPLRRSSVPQGSDMRIYRSLPFGQLVEFNMLDTRQYRSDQPCGDKRKPLCEGCYDPQATMLGAQQERWLGDHLQKSSTRWNVLAQQVMVGHVNRGTQSEPMYAMDNWSGYDVPRTRLMQFFADNPQVANPIVLTGDIHTNWVNELKVNFAEPDSPTVATEFVGTSISSLGDGQPQQEEMERMIDLNPFTKFYNGERGYVRCEVTPHAWKSDYRVVEYVSRPGAECLTRASFVVEDGKRGVQKA